MLCWCPCAVAGDTGVIGCLELGYSVMVVAESRSRACSNDPCGVSGGSWPFRIMMRVLCDCGPRLCGLGFIVSDMHSQSLWF